MTQGNFEGKLHAFRRTQDGVVVSFVIHPNDVSADLAMANLGTRMMIGYAEIGDDGSIPSSSSGRTSDFESENRGSAPREGTKPKERRPFDSLPLSQQAAIRCQDKEFQEYINEPTPDDAANFVRSYCRVNSRSEIHHNDQSGMFWKELEGRYQRWLTDRMYPAEARR